MSACRSGRCCCASALVALSARLIRCRGETKLALYGVGNIRDERFHAEMRRNRISMFRPAADSEQYFNLLVIHQNRYADLSPLD